uniref:Uncharacterized protein n=1 Tax=Ditylenchus dipsaci TaxID=166011 RepID=A0A915EPH0_9BILA
MQTKSELLHQLKTGLVGPKLLNKLKDKYPTTTDEQSKCLDGLLSESPRKPLFIWLTRSGRFPQMDPETVRDLMDHFPEIANWVWAEQKRGKQIPAKILDPRIAHWPKMADIDRLCTEYGISEDVALEMLSSAGDQQTNSRKVFENLRKWTFQFYSTYQSPAVPSEQMDEEFLLSIRDEGEENRRLINENEFLMDKKQENVKIFSDVEGVMLGDTADGPWYKNSSLQFSRQGNSPWELLMKKNHGNEIALPIGSVIALSRVPMSDFDEYDGFNSQGRRISDTMLKIITSNYGRPVVYLNFEHPRLLQKFENEFEQRNFCDWYIPEVMVNYNPLITSAPAMSEQEAAATIASSNLWELSLQDRWRLYQCWVKSLQQELIDELMLLEQQYSQSVKKLAELRSLCDVEIMRDAKVKGFSLLSAFVTYIVGPPLATSLRSPPAVMVFETGVA